MSTFIVSLLNMSITASIIIVAVICIRFLLKKAPKVFSYVLWGVVLLRLLCPITISSQFSVFNLLHVNTNTTGELQYISETAQHDSPAMTPEAGTYVPNEQPYIPLGGYEQNEYGFAPQTQVGQHTETQPTVRPDAVINNMPSVEIEKEKAALPSANTIMWVVWLAGVIVILFVNVISYLKLRNKAAACMKLQGNVYLSDEIDTPFCLGFFPAKIYLPSSLGEQERRYILMHEEYHIKRFDHVVKLFAFLALCIHWFNPLVWLAFVLAGKDMEMSCDEAVMRKMDTDIRVEYSTSLLHLATGRRFAPSPLAFGEGNPKDRIKNIMNYKKPAFWLVIVTIVVCVIVAVVLGTNPKTTEPSPDVSSSEEVESSEEEESKADTDESEKQSGSKDSERESRVEAYMELIQLAETAIYDRESLGDNYKAYCDADGNSLFSSEVMQLYDGSGDIAYQNIGYLLQDIDGDGRAELLFGENDPKPDGDWDGIVYDMYTFADNQLVHVFQGWNRCRYYLTSEGYIAMQWSSSSSEWGEEYYQFDGTALSLVDKLEFNNMDKKTICTYTNADETKTISEKEAETIQSKYHIVRPQFIPIGPIWKMVEDINEDGREDYVISLGEDGIYNKLVLYLTGEGVVFEHEDELVVDFDAICKVDLDHDEEDEVLFTMWPHVNSMPLEEYAVIKKVGDTWKTLEMYHTEGNPLDNSFPIKLFHGKGQLDAELSVQGLAKVIEFSLEPAYENAKAGNEDTAKYYEKEIKKAGVGTAIGSISSWGVWRVTPSSYAGKPCLMALQGIEGYGKFDPWGTVYIYFDYDKNGKIRILDLQFTPVNHETTDPAKEAYNAYADFFTTPDGLVGIDGYAPEQLVFSLEYIDGDETPELVVGYTEGIHAASAYILSCQNGEITVSGPVGAYNVMCFLEGTGVFFEENYGMGVEQLAYYRFGKQGAAMLLCSREREYDGQDVLLKTVCQIDGKTVSETEFENYALSLEQGKSRKIWNSYENARGYYSLTADNINLLRKGKLAVGSAEVIKNSLVPVTVLTKQGETEEGYAYQLTITKDGSYSHAKSVMVFQKDGKQTQILEAEYGFPIEQSEYSNPLVTLVDVNQDGYQDILLNYGASGHYKRGECILWNAARKQYDILAGYAALSNPEFDEENGVIKDTFHNGQMQTLISKYAVHGNSLELVATLLEDYSDGNTRYTEYRMIDGELVTTQDNLPESKADLTEWKQEPVG